MNATFWRALAAYAVLLAAAWIGIFQATAVERAPRAPLATVVSVWRAGQRAARAVTRGDPSALLLAEGQAQGAERVFEEVLDEARVWSRREPIFGASFAAALDGVKVVWRGRVAYATPDDLLAQRAYGGKFRLGRTSLPLGLQRDLALRVLARQLDVRSDTLVREGEFWRVAMRRRTGQRPRDDLQPETLRASVAAAGHYLARAVRRDGSYRYEIDALRGRDAPGYNWPRHAGATWFLAQAAAYTRDEGLAQAARSAAYHLSDMATQTCGEHACITDGDRANLGSASLALLAYLELIESGIAPELRTRARKLTEFVRSLQREDGEFMHEYDRLAGVPIDIQRPYFAGEAALALARAHQLSGDPKDLSAASRALARLVERPLAFVTARYFWGSEHWTCQALEALWEHAPNPQALRFCLAWQEANRRSLLDGPDYDGAYAAKNATAPRLTGSASRMEAAVATLAVARRAGVPEAEVHALEQGIRRTLSFLLRSQFMPGPTHLMRNPELMHGGFPGGVTDLNVRIDYPQHAGAALLRYLRLIER